MIETPQHPSDDDPERPPLPAPASRILRVVAADVAHLERQLEAQASTIAAQQRTITDLHGQIDQLQALLDAAPASGGQMVVRLPDPIGVSPSEALRRHAETVGHPSALPLDAPDPVTVGVRRLAKQRGLTDAQLFAQADSLRAEVLAAAERLLDEIEALG